MMGPQEHVNKLTIEIQILLYWKYKYLNFAKGWKVVERCLTSDSGQETCWKRSNLRYSWNSKEEKNTIIKMRSIQAHFLQSIFWCRWQYLLNKKKKKHVKKPGKNKDVSCCRSRQWHGVQNKKRNTQTRK